MKRLASKANPRVKDWSGLGDRDNRDRLRLSLAEGARLAAEGLEAPAGGWLRPAALLVSDSGAERPDAGRLFARAGELGVERYSLTDDCFAKVSGLKGADGLALLVALEGSDAEPDLPAILSAPGARWLAAAGVQDPGNAGALARTALAAGFDGCLFVDGVDPASPRFLRGSMGAAFRLPCLSVPGAAFAAGCRAGAARVILADANGGATDFRGVDYGPPVVLLVGGERGVPEALAGVADEAVRIPLHGGVESLNLAVAAGIILFEAERSWRPRNGE